MIIRQTCAVVLGGVLLLCQAGCVAPGQISNKFANAWHDMKKQMTPDPNDRRSMTEGVKNPWAQVGKDRREWAGMPATDLNDDWYRDYIMSDKAKQIESDLGIE